MGCPILILAAHLSLAPAAPGASERVVDLPPVGWQVWPNRPPADCPFPRSEALTGILFTGVHSDYRCGDTFYPSWATDGNQYSPWTDGVTDGIGSGSGGEKAVTGNAVMIGDDPLKLTIRNTSPPQPASPRPYEGRYPCGSLVHDGVWYYGTYCLGPAGQVKHAGMDWNWPVLGPMPGFRISTDFGKTWTPSPLSPSKPLFPEPKEFMGPVKMGAPHVVDFGRNLEHSPDGKAYLVGMGAEEDDPKPRYANLSWISADQVYLARVTPRIETINDIAAYEFFGGHDAKGDPIWTKDFSRIAPLLDWNNNMGCVTVTYDAPLGKYLMCVTDGWPTVAKMNSYILEADRLTGPWRLVVYMKEFGEQGYFLNFPSKFIAGDGRTMWLCYSANFSPGWNDVVLRFNPPGGRYGLCLHEVRLLAPGEDPPPPPENVLEGPANVAPLAKVEASSTYPKYDPKGAIDRNPGGFPGDISQEWASEGEKAGAWIKLSWDRPQAIRRIWLVDRPNPLDQVTAGTIEFSDGASIPFTTPLPDGGTKAVEIEFAPKTVASLKVTVTGVKPDSPNIGFSEIAVFR
ncbi:MAG: hypothetical protein JXP34_26465 [Planctomycetes bacterium]|nr:hypothetical protein [Planctomycetota bacterium]